MRKAAGIILIVLSIFQIVSMIMAMIILRDSIMSMPVFWPALFRSVSSGILIIALLVTGGILCLKKKYWELCLTLALLAFVLWILRFVGEIQVTDVLGLLATWGNWIVISATLISIIFIVSRKKEWSEISA